MTIIEDSTKGIEGIIGSVADLGQSAIDGMHGIAQSINGAVPDITENGPRSQIIDGAFSLTKSITDGSARLATSIVGSTGRALGGQSTKGTTKAK